MIILALDTSTSQGGVALLRDETVLSRSIWLREKSHSEFLTPTIENCLKETGLRPSDVDALALGRGPGSFTGIRISINVARTFAYALKIPVYAFDTLECLAEAVTRHDLPVVAMVNAHKNLIYTAVYRASIGQNLTTWQSEGPVSALSLEDLKSRIASPHLCVGDAFNEYQGFMSPELLENLVRDHRFADAPLPEVIGQMALRESRTAGSSRALDWKALQALYIRASGAEEGLGARHEKPEAKR